MERFIKDYGPNAPDQVVVGAHKARGQGRSPAVDLAQKAHLELAQQAGTLGDDTGMEYRAPLPRGPFRQGIVTDGDIGSPFTRRNSTCTAPLVGHKEFRGLTLLRLAK